MTAERRWLTLFVSLLLWAPVAKADIALFAEALGYISAPMPANYSPGTLLMVDSLGPHPGLITILCHSREVVGDAPLVTDEREGVQYSAQENLPDETELSGILQDINRRTAKRHVDRLDVDIAHVTTHTLPDEVLASVVSHIEPSCRLKMLDRRLRPSRRPPGFAVIVTSQLNACVTCNAQGATTGPFPLTDSVFTMFIIGQYLNLNGANVFPGRVVGHSQQIGWQHDQGSQSGELLALGAQIPVARRLIFGR